MKFVTLTQGDIASARVSARAIDPPVRDALRRMSPEGIAALADDHVRNTDPTAKFQTCFRGFQVGLALSIVGLPIAGIMTAYAEAQYRLQREYYRLFYTEMQHQIRLGVHLLPNEHIYEIPPSPQMAHANEQVPEPMYVDVDVPQDYERPPAPTPYQEPLYDEVFTGARSIFIPIEAGRFPNHTYAKVHKDVVRHLSDSAPQMVPTQPTQDLHSPESWV